MRTYQEMTAAAKSRIRQIDVSDAQRMHEEGATKFIDVREHPEVNLGKIPGAKHIPRGTLERDVMGEAEFGDAIIVYCAGDSRSALAADTLQEMGFTNVASLTGGFRAWAESGGEIED